jgi:hypothetical protein
MQINTNKTKHMIINQQKNQINIQPTLNNHTLEQVANYKYLGATINEELDSDAQWNETSKKTNCHIYLIKTLKSMGFKEEILVNVYQSITLSQYLYAAPLLISASRSAKEEMLKQQARFFKIIGTTAERALSQYNIPTIESYIDQQCVAVTERILKDPHHPITVAQEKKKSPHNTRPWLPICNKKNKHQQISEQLPPISTANDERWIQEQIYQPKTDRNSHR